MSYRLWTMFAAGSALLTLAACGDGGGGVAPPVAVQNQFGAAFSGAFAANANAEPIDPQPGDLPPVSLTTDPIDF